MTRQYFMPSVALKPQAQPWGSRYRRRQCYQEGSRKCCQRTLEQILQFPWFQLSGFWLRHQMHFHWQQCLCQHHHLHRSCCFLHWCLHLHHLLHRHWMTLDWESGWSLWIFTWSFPFDCRSCFRFRCHHLDHPFWWCSLQVSFGCSHWTRRAPCRRRLSTLHQLNQDIDTEFGPHLLSQRHSRYTSSEACWQWWRPSSCIRF